MNFNIAVLAGDGIGQDVMPEALRILNHVAEQYGHQVTLQHGHIGGDAYDEYGEHFPEATATICDQADAILFGSVGGPVADNHLPKWQDCEKNSILALRKRYGLHANMRPAIVYPALADICPLKSSVIGEQGLDILIIRELIGDIYFGTHETLEQQGMRYARDVAEYTEQQIRDVAHNGFQAAQSRQGRLVSVDKANVLDTSKLWRQVVTEVAAEYPDVKCEHMLVDNCAMQLIINPGQFDVIVTANLFGDILSDAAAALPGTLGLMPSASLNKKGFGLYEPSGGSAPDIAGMNKANPIAQILSVAMMLRHSFQCNQEASTIEKAVQTALYSGYCTQDIYQQGKQLVGTKEMTDEILQVLNKSE